MFNAFGSKKQPEKKPLVQEVNLQDTNDRVNPIIIKLGNSISDTKVKLDAVNKELKVALETYKNSKGNSKNNLPHGFPIHSTHTPKADPPHSPYSYSDDCASTMEQAHSP